MDGAPGPSAAGVVNAAAEEIGEMTALISDITIASPPVVSFSVIDETGRGVVGLEAGGGNQIRFVLAYLDDTPVNDAPSSRWNSLITRDRGGATQATYDREGTLLDNGDGTYEYTFENDVTTVPGYDPTLTHRLVLQISGSVGAFRLPAVNAITDFRPDGMDVTSTRNVADTRNCNECHDRILVHGNRYEAGYCVTCHNVNTETSEDDGFRVLADMSYMTHAIHAAAARRANGAPDYELGGDNYSNVTYPQSLLHCAKCHEASEATPDGDTWKTNVNPVSCGGCHEGNVDISGTPTTFEAHVTALPNCSICHNDPGFANLNTVQNHLTENPTTNNPDIPEGLSAVEYDLANLEVDPGTGDATVTFNILFDGTPIDMNDSDTTTDLGLTGSPSFLFAWAAEQGGMMPIDYNNIGSGRDGAQPPTVSVESLRGSYTTVDIDGTTYYQGTIAAAFPLNTSLRSVSMQGYYSENGTARHTISQVVAVAGEERREIVDSNKCANCHEWFEAHGGNRVFDVQVCATCHNPNLTSSGRTFDPTAVTPTISASIETTLACDPADPADLSSCGVQPDKPLAVGVLDGTNPLTWPEATQNIKDLVHGIHAAELRADPMRFVRIRGIARPYAFNEVSYPGTLSSCEGCHNSDTYYTNLPPGELPSTQIVPSAQPDDRASLIAARQDGNLPNTTDIVTTPAAAACFSCHDSLLSWAHMEQNGGLINAERSEVEASTDIETCGVCHDAGKSADVAVIHGFD